MSTHTTTSTTAPETPLNPVEVVCASTSPLYTADGDDPLSINFKLAQLGSAAHAVSVAHLHDTVFDYGLVSCVIELIDGVLDEAIAGDFLSVKTNTKYILLSVISKEMASYRLHLLLEVTELATRSAVETNILISIYNVIEKITMLIQELLENGNEISVHEYERTVSEYYQKVGAEITVLYD